MSLTFLTICIEVLPDFQETSCVQVFKGTVHRNREKQVRLETSTQKTVWMEMTN